MIRLQIPQNIPTPASEKKFRINNDPNGVQGAIRIARPFPNRHHPDFKKVMMLNTLFGGFFGSRLMAISGKTKDIHMAFTVISKSYAGKCMDDKYRSR